MKNFIFTFAFSIIILSCTNKKTENHAAKISQQKVIDSSKIEFNTKFPFGCIQLKELKYPKTWESKDGTDGILKQPEGKEFEEIGKSFQSINLTKTISQPKVKELQVVKIGDDFKDSWSLNYLLQKSIENCKYHLPSIGIYECYYSFVEDTEKYGAYGNLLLVDSKTKISKVLTIYFEGSGDSSTLYRYFLIDKNVINIYEGSCYDDGCNLDKKFEITINTKGEINVSEMKRKK